MALREYLLVVFITTSAFGGLTTATRANAQSPSGASQVVLEEIVVTAQKRAQSIQKVPSAITAFTAADLENHQMINLQEIRGTVPNLYLQEALGSVTTPKASMRGIGVANQVFSFDTPIGFYVDGVYFARITGALVDLFDVERIEVLRGPQGTLFGRNSSVGNIRTFTKNPNLTDTEFKIGVGFGTENQMNAQLAFSVPLTEDKVGLRVSLSTRNNDGFQREVNTGRRAQAEDVNAGRATLHIVPNDSLEIFLRGDFMFDHSDTRIGSNFRVNPDNDLFTFEETVDPAIPPTNEVDTFGFSGTINWSGPNFDVSSITAYRALNYRNSNDVDGLEAVRSFEVDQQDLDEWQFSQEIYASGDHLGGLDVDWVAGVFYFHENNEFTWALRIFAPPTTQFFDQDTDTTAVYAQATFPVNEKLSLTTGLRYTYEKKAIDVIQFMADGTLTPGFNFVDDITAKKVTWRAAAEYQVNDRALLYLSASTGFRSGGFNGSARDVAAILDGSFGPEDSFSLEGGAKTEWMDGRLRLNAAYFYADYDNLQMAITQSDGTISTTNVSATVHGLEAELIALATEQLQLSATLGTQFDDIENSDDELPNTPDYQARIGAVYTHELSRSNGLFRIGADVSYTDESNNSSSNVLAAVVPGYAMANANITYRSPQGHWAFTLAGYNLTDEQVNIHTFDIAGGFISSVQFVNNPRRWLLSARYEF